MADFLGFVIVCTAIAVGALVCSVFFFFIGCIDEAKQRQKEKERNTAIDVFQCVDATVGNLTREEFERALTYVARKYSHGINDRIIFDGSDPEYLAELVTETVNQTRYSDETFTRAAEILNERTEVA